ncbi:hypothetical protein [Psychrobacter celer]|uniref:hypothetical protein n=1 Tax=Psychrobacter celer TaxID=306572 RepID=UPI003FD6373A
MTYLPLCLLISIAVLTGCLPTANQADTTVDDSTIKQNTVIGDLGGVPVEIPADSVRLVEYNGDPDWGESFEGAVPERTYESKINSFGFDVRYTDGALYDGFVGELADEYDAQKNLSDSPWVSVGVNSGDRYYGAGGIDRIGKGRINARPNEIPVYIYKKLPDSQHGLEVYAPPGTDPKTNTPWREDDYAEDVFIQRDDNGIITTYIKCSNRDVEQPPCRHYFDLEPDMGLDVYVGYSRYVLKDWQQIEQVVRKALLDFRKENAN